MLTVLYAYFSTGRFNGHIHRQSIYISGWCFGWCLRFDHRSYRNYHYGNNSKIIKAHIQRSFYQTDQIVFLF